MNQKLAVIRIVLLVFVLSAVSMTAQGALPAAPQTPLGSAFTYQGQIKRGGGSFSDPTCQMVFGLYDSASAGNQVGSPITTTVSVTNGLFVMELNAQGEFGRGAFTGDARWLQTALRCAGNSGFMTLGLQHHDFV